MLAKDAGQIIDLLVEATDNMFKLVAEHKIIITQLKQERKFRAEFGEFIASRENVNKIRETCGKPMVSFFSGVLQESELITKVWHELKAQYIDSNESEVEHDTN